MNDKKYGETLNIALCGLFCAVGVILPTVFHIFGQTAGATFLPMHIPVLVSGLTLGPVYGAVTGMFAPLISALATGMPPMVKLPFMMAELLTYGIVSGTVRKLLKKYNPFISSYIALVTAMIVGRAVNWAAVVAAVKLFGVSNPAVSIAAVPVSIVSGIPGMVIQLIFVPAASVLIGRLIKNKI